MAYTFAVIVALLIVFPTIAQGVCRSTANKTEDTEPPKLDVKKPNKNVARFRSSLPPPPPDYKYVLERFKCDCFPKRISNPFGEIEKKSGDTCPARTRLFSIDKWAANCWVDWKFRNHYCPWTQCDPYGKCRYVTPTSPGTTAWCVHTDYKDIYFYLICYRNGRWEYVKQRLSLPTCCSCKVYC